MEQVTDGLQDLPCSGAPPKFSVGQRCEIIAISCDKPEHYGFEGDTKWALNTLTKAVHEQIRHCQMSRSSIHRTLQKIDLKPHQINFWLHSKDPAFKEKANNVVALYNDPPKDAIVLCIDKKTGKQGKYEHRYKRHGTLSLFSAFNTQTGHVTA